MKKKSAVNILKPTFAAAAALDFATSGQEQAAGETSAASQGAGKGSPAKRLKTPSKQVSGLVPEGDARLTANISEEHHIKLKVAAAQQRTTIGELLEQLIDKGMDGATAEHKNTIALIDRALELVEQVHRNEKNAAVLKTAIDHLDAAKSGLGK